MPTGRSTTCRTFTARPSFTYIANNGVTDSNVATVTIKVRQKGRIRLIFLTQHPTPWSCSTDTSGITFNSELGLLRRQASTTSSADRATTRSLATNEAAFSQSAAPATMSSRAAQHRIVLIGATGNDRLTGGAGDDIFVFRLGFGHDTVADFSVGDPRASTMFCGSARGLGFTSVLDILNHTDAGPNAVIHAGPDDITLLGIDKALLAAHQSALLVPIPHPIPHSPQST